MNLFNPLICRKCANEIGLNCVLGIKPMVWINRQCNNCHVMTQCYPRDRWCFKPPSEAALPASPECQALDASNSHHDDPSPFDDAQAPCH